ncbi:MAG TPA: acyl-CoA dehydrogenase family protein [Acidimicrobiia bacterium]|nr:acyl-CoA dehydrogenase family protein [Acidimicrobiia bacterium]
MASVALSLALLARETASDAEEKSQVADNFIAAFRQSGLPGVTLPVSAGGVVIDVPSILDAIRIVGSGDGSAGWVTMIYLVTAAAGHYLSPACLGEVFGRGGDALVCGVLAPRGTARRVPGGYRLSGRWPFASGCRHAAWISLGAMSEGGGVASFLLPIGDITIQETWDVMGLRASASHDVEALDCFVPEHRVFDLNAAANTNEPVGRFPIYGLLAAGIAAVCLGIAEAAIGEALDLAGAKVPTGSRRRLIDRPAVQEAIGRSKALVESGRTYLLDRARDVTESGPPPALEARARLRLAATLAVDSAREAVDLMYSAGGGSSLYSRSPLQRHFRDIHTATQHMMVAQPTWELAGKVLIGLEVDTSNL